MRSRVVVLAGRLCAFAFFLPTRILYLYLYLYLYLEMIRFKGTSQGAILKIAATTPIGTFGAECLAHTNEFGSHYLIRGWTPLIYARPRERLCACIIMFD